MKLANFTTSYWSFGQYWKIYIFMRSVYEPSEVREVVQLQNCFSLNLHKSICIQSSIMVISWNIDKNHFLSNIFAKISHFCQKVQKWGKKLHFCANWASSMNFWVPARLKMYVRDNYLYFQKIKKNLKLGNFIFIFFLICLMNFVDFDKKITEFLWMWYFCHFWFK